jgi:hypothetical protein
VKVSVSLTTHTNYKKDVTSGHEVSAIQKLKGGSEVCPISTMIDSVKMVEWTFRVSLFRHQYHGLHVSRVLIIDVYVLGNISTVFMRFRVWGNRSTILTF